MDGDPIGEGWTACLSGGVAQWADGCVACSWPLQLGRDELLFILSNFLRRFIEKSIHLERLLFRMNNVPVKTYATRVYPELILMGCESGDLAFLLTFQVNFT